MWKVATERQLAGAADHFRRERRLAAAVVARREVHQLRVGARRRREAKAQIYLMHADGGEAWKLTDAKEGIRRRFGGAYSWSPDSTRIAYVTTDPRSAEEEANIKKRDDERVFEGDFRYQHAWVVDVDDEDSRRASPKARTTRCRARRRGRPTASGSCLARADHADAARQPPRHLRGHGRHKTGREDQHELGQRRVAAMVAGRPHHRVGDRTECHHAAAGRHRVERGPPGAPGAVRRQRQDDQERGRDDVRYRSRQPDLDQRRHARAVRVGQARLQRGVCLRRDHRPLHAAHREAHHQRHLGEQGRQDHRADDGRAGFGDGDLRHRSLVREPHDG